MLTVDNEVKMLGVLKYGKTYNFTYTLHNNYNITVNIDKIVAGCNSCTKTSINKMEILPGEEAILTVAFTPGSVGINVKNLSVLYRTGHVQRPSLGLQFKANVNE